MVGSGKHVVWGTDEDRIRSHPQSEVLGSEVREVRKDNEESGDGGLGARSWRIVSVPL